MAKPKREPRHRWLSLIGDRFDIWNELEKSDARTKSITAAALVENELALAIMTRLRPLNAEEQKLLFDEDHAALHDFSAMIDMGWALNLYGEHVRLDLHRIRKIRNVFAHSLRVRDFGHADVRRYCDEMIGANYLTRPKMDPRPWSREERVLEVANHLATRFSMYASSSKMTRLAYPIVKPIGLLRPDY